MEHPHWDYYLTVLEDLGRASRFVEFTSANFRTYSVEFVRIILAAGSEIDVVAKLLCERIESKKTPQNINDYREIILARHPSISTIEITAPKHGLVFTPWREWQSGDNPAWWITYNRVKHQRNTYYTDATLENALLSSSALCILLGYLYAEFFAEKVVRRPLLFFDGRYQHKTLVMTSGTFKLP
jgi:hypothetical protein